MALDEALADLLDTGSEEGTFVSCVSGHLAYFHGEERGSRYLLEHPS
jgi:hypothetical protein